MDVRTHSSIFISGKRGVGKTSALLSLEDVLGKELQKKVFVLNIIDPSLLSENDNFLSNVLGSIKDVVTKNCKNDSRLKIFIEKMINIGTILQSINDSRSSSGLDKIIDGQDSLQFQAEFHDLLKDATNCLECKFFILPIDDIDMSFKYGFDVLERIRKCFATPYIVPIISGDFSMYHQIFTSEFYKEMIKGINSGAKDYQDFYFKKGGDNSDSKSEPDSFIKRSALLADKYLEKVLPRYRRFNLRSVREILSEDKSFTLKIGTSTGNPISLSLKDAITKIRRAFSANANDDFLMYPIPMENMREFLQFFASISKSFIVKNVRGKKV